MSIVTVQVGQCGNQIGGQLFSAIADDLKNSFSKKKTKLEGQYQEYSLERFFNEEDGKLPQARAVMVDMESKVIAQTLAETRSGEKESVQYIIV